jgi:hypothetical protein
MGVGRRQAKFGGGGQFADAGGTAGETGDDLAPRAVGEQREEAVEIVQPAGGGGGGGGGITVKSCASSCTSSAFIQPS